MTSVLRKEEFSDYATKEDLHQLERGLIDKIDSKFDSFRSEIRGEMNSFRSEMRGEMNSFRSELRDEMKSLSNKMDDSIKALDDNIKALANKMFTGISLAIAFVSFVVLAVRFVH